MKLLKSKKLILLLIILLGGFLRFYNLSWDQGQHLQPDERFLTMVGNSMKLPGSISQYFNPEISTFNPANIGHKFYVYGVLPVTFNKILSLAFGTDNYDSFVLQGRFISGFFDLLIVFLIYKTVQLFEKKYKLHQNIKYYASFFYAIAVLPIQLSHFFAVDTFLNFFMFAGFYFTTRFTLQKKIYDLMLSAIFLGLALASKITAVFLLPLVLFFITYTLWGKPNKASILKITGFALLFGLISYLALRLTDPYLFQNSSFFDVRISSLFIDNIKSLTYWSRPDAWYPPGVQWLNKSAFFPLFNIAFFGLGLPFFALVLAGIGILILRFRKTLLLPILIWVVLVLTHQSLQVSKTMRYFLILYPYFAIFAGIGFYTLTRRWKNLFRGLLILTVSIWTLFFFSIYTKNHSRVEASEWIYQNIPENSVILSEYWDDALPLRIDNPTLPQKEFTIQQLYVFDPDTEEKWQKMNSTLDGGDYYILSSNRAWGSIPTAPERYPRMSKFYKDLFAGKLKYKEIKQFTSYPSLKYLGIPLTIPDDFSEEAFTVNDHPKVIIFQNTGNNP